MSPRFNEKNAFGNSFDFEVENEVSSVKASEDQKKVIILNLSCVCSLL